MDDLVVARLVHILGVVLWIGGVGFVTTALIPELSSKPPDPNPLRLFDRLERRFARQARITTLLTGLSGLYLVWRLDLWSRFADPSFWWMHAMVVIWLVFTTMLFLIEPFFLDRWLAGRAERDPEGTLALIRRLHLGLLAASLVTVGAAVAGSHGGL
jgi:uncharacterized membrane protein